MRRSPLRRHPQRTPVSTEDRADVLSRDRGCVLASLEPGHECRDQWGNRHDPGDLARLSLEHVKSELRMKEEIHIPAEADAHLYLWTTSGFIEETFELMRWWGFSYSTTLVWAKAPIGHGLGGAYGIATEFVMFARRGSLAPLRKEGRNWWQWKRPYDERGKPQHSAKPEDFYAMVEQVSPGPYLDMFARRPRLGWDVWGDEAPGSVDLTA